VLSTQPRVKTGCGAADLIVDPLTSPWQRSIFPPARFVCCWLETLLIKTAPKPCFATSIVRWLNLRSPVLTNGTHGNLFPEKGFQRNQSRYSNCQSPIDGKGKSIFPLFRETSPQKYAYSHSKAEGG
jgi:hypothetical protein